MMIRIAVCGSGASDKNISIDQYNIAQELGSCIAAQDAVCITGGCGGIMEAVCKGVKENNGKTVGFLPFDSTSANPYVDIVLPTGIGYHRNMLIVQAADVVIAMAGKWGTLHEICSSMILQKPLVLLRGCNGFVDRLIQSTFLDDAIVPYAIVDSPDDAVKTAIRFAHLAKKKSKD